MAHCNWTLVLTVTDVKPFSGYYPCCCECLRKLAGDSCFRCQLKYPPDEVSYRYCVALSVADLTACADVVVFGASLDPMFGTTALGLHRFLNEKRISHQNSLSSALRASLESMFLGRCFAFEFKSRLSDKTPSSLSTILKQNGLGMTRGCQQSLIASRIRPTTAITRDTTVLAGIEGYLQQLESLGNESATCTQGAVSHSHSVKSTCFDHDSSSLLYQSGKQENSQCIALVSYNCEDTSFVPVLTPPAHPLAVTTPQLNDSSKVSSRVCDSKEADPPSVPELCDESLYHFFDTISTQDIQCACDERQVTGPSHDEECTPVYSDLEAKEIVQELFADWKSTQIQEPQSNPLAEGNEEDVELEFTTTQLSSPEKEFSPSALSTDFLTSFMGSFDVCTTPKPTQPTRHRVFSSVHRPGVVETPSFSASARVSYPGETPELFSGSRTPCPLSVLNTIGSSTDASPELFGSSKPHQHLFPRVANSCIRMPLFITPSAKRSQPRRTIIQELNIASPSMDQMRSAPIQSRHTKIRVPPLEEKCASSPDLFSP